MEQLHLAGESGDPAQVWCMQLFFSQHLVLGRWRMVRTTRTGCGRRDVQQDRYREATLSEWLFRDDRDRRQPEHGQQSKGSPSIPLRTQYLPESATYICCWRRWFSGFLLGDARIVEAWQIDPLQPVCPHWALNGTRYCRQQLERPSGWMV